MKLIVVFGLPGAGKTFVGELLQKYFDFFLYEADQIMPEELKKTIFQQKIVSDHLRDEFFSQLIKQTEQLQRDHEKIVITQTFIKEKYRKQFLQSFPQTTFLFVTADTKIREGHLLQKKEWPLTLSYWQKMAALFEPPKINYKEIDNSSDGEESIIKQLKAFI